VVDNYLKPISMVNSSFTFNEKPDFMVAKISKNKFRAVDITVPWTEQKKGGQRFVT